MTHYGWTNRATWNVALWLQNNEEWTNHIGESTRYLSEIEWIDSTTKLMVMTIGWKKASPQDEWEISYETPDGVEYMPWYCTDRKRMYHPEVNWAEIYQSFREDWAEEEEE